MKKCVATRRGNGKRFPYFCPVLFLLIFFLAFSLLAVAVVVANENEKIAFAMHV